MKNKLLGDIWIFLFVVMVVPISAQQMSVVSLNLYGTANNNINGKYNWANRRDAIIAMINETQPTIFGVQDAQLDQISYIDHSLRFKYRRVGVASENGFTKGEYTAIYYNTNTLQLIEYETFWLSNTPNRVSIGWDAKNKRTVTYAKFRVKSTRKELYYFNTHIDNEGQIAQKESFAVIARIVNSLTTHGASVILGGDMSCNPDNTQLMPISKLQLESARALTSNRDTLYTYHRFNKNGGGVIDHFYVKGIAVNRISCIRKQYRIGKKKVEYLSDHYPLQMIFTL